MSDTTERFDLTRIDQAVELIEHTDLQPIVRRAADEFYERVMQSAEDWLRDNVQFNLKAHVEMLERDNAQMRRELYEIGQVVGTPWNSHEERLEVLRRMDRASAELTTLRYKIQFEHPAIADALLTDEPEDLPAAFEPKGGI